MRSMAAPHDTDSMRALLGRRPRAAFEVVVRDARGEPVVIRNAPFTDDGTPMPTRYWLVDRMLVAAVSRLEAAGGVREAEAVVDRVELDAAHAVYAADRDADVAPDHRGPRPSGGVGGTVIQVVTGTAFGSTTGQDPRFFYSAGLGTSQTDLTLAVTVK